LPAYNFLARSKFVIQQESIFPQHQNAGKSGKSKFDNVLSTLGQKHAIGCTELHNWLLLQELSATSSAGN
jgi:hypothetical protein